MNDVLISVSKVLYNEPYLTNLIFCPTIFISSSKLPANMNAPSETTSGNTSSNAPRLKNPFISSILTASNSYDFILGSIGFSISKMSTPEDSPAVNTFKDLSGLLILRASSFEIVGRSLAVFYSAPLLLASTHMCFPFLSSIRRLGTHLRFFSK